MAHDSGLITPPETPKYYNKAATDTTTEANSASVSATVKDDKQPHMPQLEQVSEIIYTIIEHAVEEKIAEAIGPLRLNLRRLDRENCDFHEQNDTLSRQIDLHYKSIERHNDVLDKLSSAQATTIGTASNLVGTANDLVSNLSQTVASLPSSIHKVVATSVQEQVQTAVQQVLASQQPQQSNASNRSRACYAEQNRNRWQPSNDADSIGSHWAYSDESTLRSSYSARVPRRHRSAKSVLAGWLRNIRRGNSE